MTCCTHDLLHTLVWIALVAGVGLLTVGAVGCGLVALVAWRRHRKVTKTEPGGANGRG